jgi:cell division protein FtsN
MPKKRGGAWALAVGLSAALMGAYWVVTHFAERGVKSEKVEASEAVAEAEPLNDVSVTDDTAPSDETAPVTTQSGADDDTHGSSEPAPKLVEALPNPHAHEASAEKKEVAFTFYQGLAEAEVVVDAIPLSVKLDVPHYIQAGSFGAKRYALAEQKRLKAHGQSLTVSKLTTEHGTYYRLRMGPFDDRLALNKQRNALRRLGVDTLIIRDQQSD